MKSKYLAIYSQLTNHNLAVWYAAEINQHNNMYACSDADPCKHRHPCIIVILHIALLLCNKQ